MKFPRRIAFLLVLLLFPLTIHTEEAEVSGSPLSYGGEADFNSRYIWRGIEYSQGVVANPSTWISFKDLTFNVWGNLDLQSQQAANRSDEIDLILSYERDLGKIKWEPTFQYYFYPGQVASPSTGELTLKFSYPVGPVSIFTSHNFDLVRYRGSYFGEFGISASHDFSEKLSLDSSLSVGAGSATFNATYLGPSLNTLDEISLDLSFTYTPYPHFSIRPHLLFASLIDPALRGQVNDPTLLSGGIAFGTTF